MGGPHIAISYLRLVVMFQGGNSTNVMTGILVNFSNTFLLNLLSNSGTNRVADNQAERDDSRVGFIKTI